MQCDTVKCYGGYTNTGINWLWNNSDYDWGIYAHTFDQNGPNGENGTPYQYSSDIDDWTYYMDKPNTIPRCTLDYDDSIALSKRAKELYGNNQKISNQISCKASQDPAKIYNVGNFYNFSAATAGSDDISTTSRKNMPNSICPKGWQLPPNSGDKSYYKLIHDTYNITVNNSDTDIFLAPLSFVRLGFYKYDLSSLLHRSYAGLYWSSTADNPLYSYYLRFDSGLLEPRNGADRAYGFSIRCVSR